MSRQTIPDSQIVGATEDSKEMANRAAKIRESMRNLNQHASALKLMTDHHEPKASAHSSMRSRVANSVIKPGRKQ